MAKRDWSNKTSEGNWLDQCEIPWARGRTTENRSLWESASSLRAILTRCKEKKRKWRLRITNWGRGLCRESLEDHRKPARTCRPGPLHGALSPNGRSQAPSPWWVLGMGLEQRRLNDGHGTPSPPQTSHVCGRPPRGTGRSHGHTLFSGCFPHWDRMLAPAEQALVFV